MLVRIGFDLAQVMMETERNLPALSKKSLSSNANMEKENYETNVYNHWKRPFKEVVCLSWLRFESKNEHFL